MTKTVQISVRISPEARELVQKHAEGEHGKGYLIDKAIKTYLKDK